ncbi:adenosylmethionine--8-amino-7-oxononanoate transaminase [Paenibacillus sp. N1-5-1-14]|uniref:adenosylmethionine--8-amino-7-oxononanoate transaminase n=1 Tax=Paenibacillus radicibacter TaxID=2972488 RepID=UPI0021592431|nr:adenosylmethionine--8-amino-7-oxononanoate transaminase [Paenibacillus radicibacter]MCR8642056.1 adenosylmethionine--8-amino-7-oxononanoate transaminase [Paenibacillus radicibacter]
MTHTYEELLEKNRKYLWNPFTQMKTYLADEPLIIASGQGVKVTDARGKEYYDANASVWLNPHGHNRQELNDAIIEQLGQIAHSTLLGSANIPALLLAERLVQITPERLQKVFYSDSGAASVEIGLKMAYQYWNNKGRPEKCTLLTMKNAYHGDTVGAVSVGGIDGFHKTFEKLLFHTEKVSYPYPYRFNGTAEECVQACLTELEQKLIEKADQIAGMIIEPMVQGAGGMIMMPAGFLKQVEALCRKYDVLMLVDEVATGFGRTGKMFACEHDGVQPDIMMVGKKLTGGYLPVAVTLTSDEVYDAFYGEHRERKTFYHGHSYTGNQLGCAVALASLDIYEKDQTVAHVQRMSEAIKPLLQEIETLDHVGEVRQLGLMIGIELVADKASRRMYDWMEARGASVCRRAVDLGLLTRPLDDVVTFMPPLVSTQEELTDMLRILRQAIQEVTEP